MQRDYRKAFNAHYSPEFYARYLARLEKQLGTTVPFRVAETPFFIPTGLRRRLAEHARAIVKEICDPSLISMHTSGIPPRFDVPRMDQVASCIQVDFAIVQNEDGELDGKLVEFQGFPSLYAFTLLQAEAMAEELKTIPGLDRPWTALFDMDRDEYVRFLRDVIVADQDPREVILMDLDPLEQKTYPDFVATKQLIGVDFCDPGELEVDGRTLYRRVDNKRVKVSRIYNRVVFDELERSGRELPFRWRDDLDVTWVPHPNWYWVWSKFTIPKLKHSSVPKAQFVSELAEIPHDLANYVLKPLFSFAGTGVVVDVSPEDITNIPPAQRNLWLLQEKITYAPSLEPLAGPGIKAEVRMMFARRPGDAEPTLVLNLSRLSRGKMHGVDHNRDFDWVGGTVGIWGGEDE
ncbi:MAG: hypothetical protein Q8Q09_17905 [Deltaproteobacteria bacterium]|nr:hypothetical protein [Deltaproteobacteria bacterium]